MRAPGHLLIALSMTLLSGFGPCSSSPPKPEQAPARSTATEVNTANKNTAPEPKSSKSNSGATPVKPERALRIAAWNVAWLNAEPMTGTVKRSVADYARLKRYADTLAPDIIALSEVDGPDAAARLFDPREYSFHFSRAGGAQRTGFAYRSELPTTLHPDLESLATGGLRSGTDMTLGSGKESIRLLAVHLKSGCFLKPLSAGKACAKLARQVPIVEAWIDARAAEGVAFAVLGDFNRVLFRNGREDLVWQDWNDGEPVGLKLWSPTNARSSRCWNGKYPDFVDHLILDNRARNRFLPDSFKEHVFLPSEAVHRRVLSDHCALSAELHWTPSVAPPFERVREAPKSESTVTDIRRIKGNITRDGRKIYHAPECPSYEETRIDPAKGESLFIDPRAAEASGFQRAGNCPTAPLHRF